MLFELCLFQKNGQLVIMLIRLNGKQVVSIALCDDRFWKSIQYCLKYVTLLVKILRLMDGDSLSCHRFMKLLIELKSK